MSAKTSTSEKMNISEKTIAPTSSLQVEKSPDFRLIYSNSFEYRLTVTDFSLIFSTNGDTGNSPRTFVQTQQVAVVMALGQVKNLWEYLGLIISRYEKEIGPIASVGKVAPAGSELDNIFEILTKIGVH